ncbi:hypothetical protein NDU88_002358 [Pleurodeles waltl]|uniref:Uncharacterized protein n=1 Tax=Pleurodeles waltl TaxID=8319 RepID=A0AAV7WPY2_PLEWA|nr:hypothetical protein NDU88_002358 [Pleurodeles waltl]
MVVEDFTLSDSDIVHLPCPPETNIFHVLDVSENRITDVIFQNCSSLVHLETLNLRRNKLEELAKIFQCALVYKDAVAVDADQVSNKKDDHPRS